MFVLRLFFLVVLLPFSTLACEKIVRVIEFAPYSMEVEDKWTGFHVELGDALLKTLDCKPIYVEFPFARALSLLKTGQIDIVFQLTMKEDRKPYIHFIGPIHTEELILVASDSVKRPITHLEQIAQYEHLFGVQRGVYMGPDFEDLFQRNRLFRNKFRYMHEVDPLITMVLKHRLDGFFIDKVHFSHMQNMDPNYKKVSIHPVPVYKTPVYLGLSKQTFSEEDKASIQDAYQTLKSNGKLAQLRRKFITE